ncbi:MAG: T9SS type A sorting domain-containing protein [Bacteroidia bacterium]
MQKFTRYLIFPFFFLYFSYIQAGVIYVNHGASGAANGTSWADAYTTLQAAIDAAAYSGDEIWVAEGTYFPTKNNSGAVPADARQKTFRIYKSISIYGGFNGTETLLTERNPKTNETILSGIQGITNVYQVVYISSTSNIILDGFTITGGIANGSSSYSHGGGIYLSNANNVLLQNLLITQNEGGNGGGIYNVNTSAITVNQVRFRGNEAIKGGAMYNDNTSSITVKNSVLCNNHSEEAGGAIYNKSLSVFGLINCVFSSNSTLGNGGGCYNNSISAMTITNSTFYGNSADGNGGGFYVVSSSSCEFYNSIFWDNIDQSGSTAANSQAWANNSTSAKTSYYTLIKGSNGSGGSWSSAFSDGGHNLDANPLFFDIDGNDNSSCSEDDNFGLSAGSPCINAGTNTAPGITASDAEGESRVQAGTVDLGPFEGIADAGFPVEWTFIEGDWAYTNSGRVAALSWGTAQEINNDYFAIERTVAGQDWEEVGRIDGSGTTDRSSVYHFEDAGIPVAADGVVFSYRIRQTDIDGNFSYSQTVELVVADAGKASFAVYPNPASGQVTLNASVEGEENLDLLRILSLNGQIMYEVSPQTQKWEDTIDVSNLPAGMYFAQMVFTNGQKSIRLMIR